MSMGKNGNQVSSSSRSLAIKRAKLRRLLLESLERRELMAVDSAAPVFAPGTPQSYVNEWINRLKAGSGASSGEQGGNLGGNGGGNFETGAARWRNPVGGPSPNEGDPSTVTWSIVPDGTQVNDINGTAQPSNLVAFLDGVYGGGSGPISQRPWFPIVKRAYDRWASISGLNFVYEPNDDGAPQNNGNRGVNGVRGDVRIGGTRIDGDSGILAFNYFPNAGGDSGFDGDMVIDTADNFYQSASDGPSGENRGFFNVLTHEAGHGIGLGHVEPVNETKLMEPFISFRFLGPQHDDTLGAQRLYGDDLEPNNAPGVGTSLGQIRNGIRQFSGLSMNNNADRDFFTFDAPSSGKISITVSPIGFQYQVGPQGGQSRPVDTLRNSDLSFQLLGSDGQTVLAQVNAGGLGVAEALADFDIKAAGKYFIRVDGAQDAIQLYDMNLVASGFRVATDTDSRAPQLISVNPNAGSILSFTAPNVLSVSPTELTFRFDGAQQLDARTLKSIRITRSGYDGTFGNGNDVVIEPGYLGFGDTQRVVIARFKDALPNDVYRIEIFAFDDPDRGIIGLRNLDGVLLQPRVAGTDRDVVNFRLELGAQIVSVVPQPVSKVGSTLVQRRDEIEVYFNEDDLWPSAVKTGDIAPNPSVVDPSFYQLILTNDTIRNTDDLVKNPLSISYDPLLNKAVLKFENSIDQLFGASLTGRTYRLKIGTNEVIPSAPAIVNPATDPGDSFDTKFDLGNLGASPSLLISSQIVNPTLYNQDFPGAPDTPGDREIQAENHLQKDAPDTTPGISVQYYNFLKDQPYGTNSQGQLLFSSITPTQEQRIREVFSFYEQYLGIKFVETNDPQGGNSWTIAVGDLAPLGATSAPGGTLGIAGKQLPLTPNHTFGRPTVILDSAETWNDSFGASDNAKPSFFVIAMHEIGHLLGLDHSSELPPGTIMGGIYTNQTLGGEQLLLGNNPVEPVFPGDNDIVHGRYLFRPESKDIDLYKFSVPAGGGKFSAEVIGQRLTDASLLDSYLTLFRTNADGSKDVIAVNDDYYSNDSFLQLDLPEGDYYLGVSASGNSSYNPDIRDSGLNGTSEGKYQLRTTFQPKANSSIVDIAGTALDGDADGNAGGAYNFWFRTAAPLTSSTPSGAAKTIFVDKSRVPTAGLLGTLTNPYNTISAALSAAQQGDVVRIVGNGGIDGNFATQGDNYAYEIGRGGPQNSPLSDGLTMNVPKGVTVMVDAGAILKLRGASINVGSTTSSVDRSRGNLQVLGTPTNQVVFTSYNEETIGIDTNPLRTTAASGDWGGIEFKNDIDRSEGRFDREREGVFLNYVNNADIRFGGGQVSLDSQTRVISPIQLTQSRATLSYNTITRSADAAISADPDSFEESTFVTPVYQLDGIFTPDYSRVGPEIHGNRLANNTTNGLFVRIDTLPGNKLTPQTVAGRWDDTDIVYVVGQNLFLQGSQGGPKLEDIRPAINQVQLNAVAAGGSLAAGLYNYRVVFVDANGGESIPSNATQNVTVSGANNTVQLANLPPATSGFVSRRVYRSQVGGAGPYNLVAEINRSDSVLVDRGQTRPNQLNVSNSLNRARLGASLVIDPGLIVKIEGARIEAGIGTTLIAEGKDGIPVVFTSRRDDRYGASGTFDTNNDGASNPNPGDWGGIVYDQLSRGSLDHVLVTYGGGQTNVSGSFANFNATEIHQASVRIANSVYENNASGFGGQASLNRDGRGFNEPAVIFVRGAQPTIVNNIIRDNISPNTPAISINANAMTTDSVLDEGRQRGEADRVTRIVDNLGPLVNGNFLGENAINGLQVRGQTLTTATAWDDSDIVHVLRDEIIVPDFHTFGGLTLKSRPTESLVVKLSSNAGFTATGRPLDITDRIGGRLHIVGSPGFPVVLTSLRDDTVGSGFDPNGQAQNDTNGDGPSVGSPGDWRSIRLDQYSNDRNVETVIEQESPQVTAPGTNAIPGNAQQIGDLAPNEKAGDDNRRLGFSIQGVINEKADVDVYSFEAEGGTQVWFDIDRTTNGLDTIVELIDGNGNIIAQSDNSYDESIGNIPLYKDVNSIAVNRVNSLPLDPAFPKNGDGTFTDFYSTNPFDAGMRVVLPGATGGKNTYFVRVRSSNIDSLDPSANRADLQDPSRLLTGKSTGRYELNIRLRELDEVAGSTVRYTDVRFATTGIEVLGMPMHSPLLGEAIETGPDTNDAPTSAVPLGNIASADRAAVSFSGAFTNASDVDWYRFDVNQDSIQGSGLAQHLSTIIDVDYADGLGRPNTNLWLFYDFRRGNVSGPVPLLRLVASSNDSNVADDRASTGNGTDLKDLSRGSLGFLDAYLGSQALPSGTYYLAVTNNSLIPSDMRQFQEASPPNPLARVEPVNSVVRLAEDRFNPAPASTATGPVQVAFSPTASPVAYQLGDVVMFVTAPDGNQSALYTVSPISGRQVSDITRLPLVNDIAMRPDGNLYGYRIDTNTKTDAASGDYMLIDTAGDGATSVVGNSGIQTFERDTNVPPGAQQAFNPVTGGTNGVGIEFSGITYTNVGGNLDLYGVGSRGFFANYAPVDVNTRDARNYVYQMDPGTGAASSAPQADRTDAARATGGGTQIRERGYINTTAEINPQPSRVLYTSPAVSPVGNIIDGDIITAGGTTFEFDFGNTDPSIRLNIIQSGQAPRDGQTFRLTVGATNYNFQFDTGRVIVVGAGGSASLEGETFTITDTTAASRTFEFSADTALNNAANVRVPYRLTDSTAVLTNSIIAAINGAGLGFQAQTVPNTGRISITGDTALTEASATLTLSGEYGVTGGATAIPVEEYFDNAQVAAAIMGVLNGTHPSGVVASAVGNQVTFKGATTGAFNSIPWIIVSSTGQGVQPGRVAIPFTNNDSAEEIARSVFTSMSSVIPGITWTGNSISLPAGVAFDALRTNFQRTPAGLTGPLALDYAPPSPTNPLNQPFANGLSMVGSRLYAVTSTGDLFEVGVYNSFSGTMSSFNPASTTNVGDYIATVLDPATGRPVSFSGLTTGPRNVEGGKFANTLFGIASNGDIYAFDTRGRLVPAFANGASKISTGVVGANGLAFSNLDVNLWHLSDNRSSDAGHGTVATFDGTRGDVSGGSSLYFGFEDPLKANRQTGIWTGIWNPNDTNVEPTYSGASRLNTVNLPGGAKGSMESNPLDLSAYSAGDKPTLYFSYYLATENINSDLNDSTVMRDSLRVFAAGPDGQWHLLATNNSQFDNERVFNRNDEHDYFLNGTDQQIQELYDVNDNGAPNSWRQAKLDLSKFAGVKDVRIRIDFATAGDMGLGTLGLGGEELRAVAGSKLRDGQTFVVDGRTFEFDLGATISAPSGANIVQGSTFSINGITYTFTATPVAATDIEFSETDSPATIASRIAVALQSQGENVQINPEATHRVSVTSATSVTASAQLPASFVDGRPGVTAGNEIVSVAYNMSDIQVRDAVRVALARAFNALSEKTNIDTFRVNKEIIRLVTQRVTNPGPLGLSRQAGAPNSTTRLPGDQFGSSPSDLRTSALRGQRNQVEGVYIDDIVIGFAERGEMITGGQDDAFTFSSNRQYEPQSIDGSTKQEVELGSYQVEVRRGADYGVTTGYPNYSINPLLGGRSFDTNQRMTPGISLIAKIGSELVDGSTFTLSDGVTTVTFEYSDTTIPSSSPFAGVTQGNVAVPFTPNSTAAAVAKSIRDAINSPGAQALLKVTAALSDSSENLGSGSNATRVDLFGTVAADNQGSLAFGAIDFVQNGVDTFSRGDWGDQNTKRDQGQIILNGNIVRDSSSFGIVIDNGARTRNDLVPLAGALPHVGPVRALPQLNTEGLVPGVVATNNVLAQNRAGGILFSGDTRAPGVMVGAVPFGRITNNTVYGTGLGDVGIRVTDNSSPTLLNNIVANTSVGVSVDNTSSTTVLGTTLFQNNGSNVSGVTLGAFPIVLTPTDPLFVSGANYNYYPIAGSKAIDSSLDALADRPEIVSVKTSVGIPVSPILAPDRDVTGQLRVDDPSVSTPAGQGANVFKDRGAYDRADFVGPTAQLLVPQDNDSERLDIDPNQTYVQLLEGTLDHFSLLIVDDNGTGPDVSSMSKLSVSMTEDGRLLREGIDFTFGFSATNRTIRLTPLSGIWRPGSAYELTLNNRDRFVITAPNGGNVIEGQQFRIVDGNNVSAVYEYESGFSIKVPQTLTLVIPAVGAGTGGIVDGQVFKIGIDNKIVTFELDSNSNIVAGNVRVPFAIGDTVSQVRDKILTVLLTQAGPSQLNLAPKAVGTDRIHLGSLSNHTLDISGSAIAPEGVSAGVEDGQTFRFTQDGVTKTFEFNVTGNTTTTAGNVVIAFDRTDTNAEIAAKITAALQAAAFDLPILQDLGAGVVHLGGRSGQSLSTAGSKLSQSGAPGVTAGFVLTVPSMTGPNAIQDGETFKISKGGSTITFEFNSNSTTTPGNTVINFSPLDSADTVATAVANVIRGTTLGLNPTTQSGGRVKLNEGIGYTIDTSTTRLTQTGVSGGAIPIVYVPTAKFDGTQMAGVIINAINGTGFGISARSRGSDTVFLNDASAVSGISNFFVKGITDIAGNALQANRSNQETQFTILLPGVQLDYGDAAEPGYATLLTSNGARHVVLPNNPLRLGATISSETDGKPSPAGNLDTSDDGVTFAGIFNAASNPVQVTATASAPGLLNAWIDWNADGDWNDPGEQILRDTPVRAGANTFSIVTPTNAAIGTTFARFRLSTAGGIDTTGVAMDGEVEDYQITVLPGSPPVGTTDQFAIVEDSSTGLVPFDTFGTVTPGVLNDNGVFANDNDPMSQTLSATLVTGPTNAQSFAFDPVTGLFSYTPKLNFVGVDTFVYRLNSSSGLVANNLTTVSITVAAKNDAPTTTSKSFVGAESLPLQVSAAAVLLGDSAGPDQETAALPVGEGQTIDIVAVDSAFPAGSSVSLSGGIVTFTPPANFSGQATFRYTVRDNGKSGVIADNAVTGTADDFQEAFGTVTINFTPVNDPPTFTSGGNVTVDEDSAPYSQPWASNISPGPADEAGQTVSFPNVTVDRPELFLVVPKISDTGVLTFTVAPNANGAAKVTVVAQDSGSGVAPNRNQSTPVVFTLTINSINDVPVASNTSRSATEDDLVTFAAPGLLALVTDNDLPNDVVKTFAGSATSTLGAAVTVNENGAATYDPRNVPAIQALRPGQTLVDRFTYFAKDAANASSNLATVTITISGVNDAPVARNDSYTVGVAQPTKLSVLSNDTDVDSAINVASIQIEDLPSFGTAVVNADGTVTYTSSGTFRGNDSFTYRVRDAQGALSNLATVSVLVNNAPIAVNDQVFTVKDTAIDINVLGNDRDPDGTLDPSTVQIASPPAVGQGTVAVLPNGRIRFTPASGFVGTALFTYNVKDDAGTVSNNAQVRVQVLKSAYQNPTNNLDVNADGFVSPIDALLIINDINRNGARPLPPGLPTPPYLDVNGDGGVSPIDALVVINYLNSLGNGEGSGEGEGLDVAAMSGALVTQTFVTSVSPEEMLNTVGASVVRETQSVIHSSVFSSGRPATVPSAVSYPSGRLSLAIWDDSEIDSLSAAFAAHQADDDKEDAADALLANWDDLLN